MPSGRKSNSFVKNFIVDNNVLRGTTLHFDFQGENENIFCGVNQNRMYFLWWKQCGCVLSIVFKVSRHTIFY